MSPILKHLENAAFYPLLLASAAGLTPHYVECGVDFYFITPYNLFCYTAEKKDYLSNILNI